MESDDQNLSERKRSVLRHALGWPTMHRNHFVTGSGSCDYEDCEALVSAGYMDKTSVSWVPDTIYRVTKKGIAAAQGIVDDSSTIKIEDCEEKR